MNYISKNAVVLKILKRINIVNSLQKSSCTITLNNVDEPHIHNVEWMKTDKRICIYGSMTYGSCGSIKIKHWHRQKQSLLLEIGRAVVLGMRVVTGRANEGSFLRSWDHSLSWSEYWVGEYVQLVTIPRAGFPWWLRGEKSIYQCRRHGFHPWSGKIPRATEQQSLGTTIVELVL